jgi:hypothetical protein
VVAAGKAEIGDTSRVKHIPSETITKARLRIKKLLEYAVDSMKLSADDATVILVGGGSIVHMDDLEGVNRIIRPQYVWVLDTDAWIVDSISIDSTTVPMLSAQPSRVCRDKSTSSKCWKVATKKMWSTPHARKRSGKPL